MQGLCMFVNAEKTVKKLLNPTSRVCQETRFDSLLP